LTDGKTWSFYLPAEQGSYEDRRVYKLDLFERSSEEAAEILNRYIGRSRVESGAALETARSEYRSRSRKSQAKSAIPDAWRELVEKGHEQLVDLLASTVESKAGVRPDKDDVAEFLALLGKPSNGTVVRSPTSVSRDPSPPSGNFRPPPEAARRGNLILSGSIYPYANAKDAMVTVLRELAKSDSAFLERCSQHQDAQGRKRRYLARNPGELYPDRPDLQEYNEALPGGWFVATNLNKLLKKTIIRLAAEVAGLSFGKDVVVDF
jgi:predicted type IV restriction endonuclease